MESEIRFPSFSTLVTLTDTSWPTVRASLACATRRREISVTWTRPSTPPRSTNAPKSVIERTLPVRTAPRTILSRISPRLFSMASRMRAARLTTTRRPSSAYSMTRKSNDWLTNSRRPGSSWRPTSIWETGQNARGPPGPPMATSKPPLLRERTLPRTGIPVSQAARSSAFARRAPASFFESRMSGPALMTTASIRSPTFSPSSSWRSISASDLAPIETRTTSGVMPAIIPLTASPSWGRLLAGKVASRAASNA